MHLSEIESFLSSNTETLGDDVRLSFFQSNSEGEIVTSIQDAYGKFDGIIINPGAYTHTSVAIRDAILSTGMPYVSQGLYEDALRIVEVLCEIEPDNPAYHRRRDEIKVLIGQ